MESEKLLRECRLCPRDCGVDRTSGQKGFCGCGSRVKIARAELHRWEEPCISGKNGSGTVFFSGCSLKCCFCQNYEISDKGKGFELSCEELAETFLRLRDMCAHNIDLVTPTPYVPQIVSALDKVRGRLDIPIVYNCGGYEEMSTLELLRDRVDVFLPDLKYYSAELSAKYSGAADYFVKASAAIKKMAELTGKPVFDENGLMKKGVIVRHLVLPNGRHDSAELIRWLSENFEKDSIMVSLMSQFTPVYHAFDHKELSRRTSTFEYEYVAGLLQKTGFDGYFQQRSSADEGYIPEFFDRKYY
ncbi:MAG: radical SAM protein [Ruminococcus sp.]|nr:radical SAM protein [Ruminococcus sp.]